MKETQQRGGAGLVLAGASLWGLIGLFNRALLGAGLGPESIVLVRNLGGLVVLALVLAVSLAVPALAADEPVTLDQTKLSLSPKQSVVLHATRSSEYQDQRITWKSSDTSVATLSDQDHKKGNVTITAKKKGTTAITASVGGCAAVSLASPASRSYSSLVLLSSIQLWMLMAPLTSMTASKTRMMMPRILLFPFF